jgi:predicted secreted hydrolase
MKRLTVISVLDISLVFSIFLISGCLNTPEEPLAASLIAPGDVPDGFLRADSTKKLTFPDDFGPHPDYQTEWWYYTGNLKGADGRHFGYQLTFFRRALQPASERVARESAWASDQVYMAHFALSDVSSADHYAFERFSREGIGLAGAQAVPFQVWLEDWEVRQSGEGVYQLHARQGDLELDLELRDLKGPVLHGENGYSQKGSEGGNASHYFSQTRLKTTGVVRIGGQEAHVEGFSWMDHEFSTSALADGQVGWDWFSFHLDEGSELMVFQIRRADGTIDPFSSGTLVHPDGSTVHLSRDDFEIVVEDTWSSAKSGGEYPAKWAIQVPEFDLTLRVKPYLSDQEMVVSYAYWEGAVQVEGTYSGGAILGSGYVEMTGYATSMAGQF